MLRSLCGLLFLVMWMSGLRVATAEDQVGSVLRVLREREARAMSLDVSWSETSRASSADAGDAGQSPTDGVRKDARLLWQESSWKFAKRRERQNVSDIHTSIFEEGWHDGEHRTFRFIGDQYAGSIRADEMRVASLVELVPLAAAFRPVAMFDLDEARCSLAHSDDPDLWRLTCHSMSRELRFWVRKDSAQVVRFETLRGDHRSLLVTLSYAADAPARKAELPLAGWTMENGASVTEATITELQVNRPIPAAEFVIFFPPGTHVYDATQKKEYMVLRDLSQRDVSREDLIRGIRRREWLADGSGAAQARAESSRSYRRLLEFLGTGALLLGLFVGIRALQKNRRKSAAA